MEVSVEPPNLPVEVIPEKSPTPVWLVCPGKVVLLFNAPVRSPSEPVIRVDSAWPPFALIRWPLKGTALEPSLLSGVAEPPSNETEKTPGDERERSNVLAMLVEL